MTFSQTFEADQDPAKKNYDIHIVAELNIDEAPTSKEVLQHFETMLDAIRMTPVAAQCKTSDGEFTTEVWVDDDAVGFHELITAYRERELFLDQDFGVEFYQRTDMKWAWRMFARNGQIIATDGGQGYENRHDATQMVYDMFGSIPISVTALHAATQPALWNGQGSISLDVPAVAKGGDDE